MDAPDTVTEAIEQLELLGFSLSISLSGGTLVFGRDAPSCALADAVVEHMFRFEGDSDPGDEMVVFALTDVATGRRGTLVSGYGPAADPEVFEHLDYLAAHVNDA